MIKYVKTDGDKKSKPNLYLCAAPRSGSTQLAAWLNTHSHIEISFIKEPNFFSQHEFSKKYVNRVHLNDVNPEKYLRTQSTKKMQFAVFRTIEQYEYLFSHMKAKWRLDASTTYLQCPEAPEAIKSYNPDAKIIILTRNPVARALSHYRLAIRTGRTQRTLREELEEEVNGITELPARFLLRQSRYEIPLKRFRSTFDAEQLFEIRFEDMIADPLSTMNKLAFFLDLDHAEFNLSVREQNAGDSPRFPSLNTWLMESGVKTILRNLLPQKIKRILKNFYFTKKTKHTPTYSEEEQLRILLETAKDELL